MKLSKTFTFKFEIIYSAAVSALRSFGSSD